MAITFRTRWSHANPVSPCGKQSMTSAQFMSETDINSILRTYKITGALPPARAEGQYIDCSEIGDFAESIQRVTEAKQLFDNLPSTVRARFGHSPEQFYDFVMNEDNADECVKLGLAVKYKKPATLDDVVGVIVDKGVTAPAAEGSTPPEGSVPTT